jgi:hypothetical protein
MSTTTIPNEILRGEITRFLQAAKQRSECSPAYFRRGNNRYHRSWPLQVTAGASEMTVALHNASEGGLAFFSPCFIEPGGTLLIRLFCHREDCRPIPVTVRHATANEHGFLIGCEFAFGEEEAEPLRWAV